MAKDHSVVHLHTLPSSGDHFLFSAFTCSTLVIVGVIGDPSESGVLSWLGTILWYIFTGFWVLPIFWISKPINSIWFMVCRFHGCDETGYKYVDTDHEGSADSIEQSLCPYLYDST